MKTVETVASLRTELAGWREDHHLIGLAPTMGNLHDGHLSLIETLRRSGASRIVVTIFVNPLQFGTNEDFDAYPRTMEDDRRKLETAGVDLLFAPPVGEIYSPGQRHPAVVDLPSLSSDLCGAHRPGHFRGVATVVATLFNIVRPDQAVFGEKDYQQLVLIRNMAASLRYPIEVLSSPTMREVDGLAISSRNRYLTEAERKRAPLLYKALTEARTEILDGRPLRAVEAIGFAKLERQGFRPDYFAVRNADDLAAPEESGRPLVVLAAAHLGTTRLIDNLRIDQ